jgi:hypothetical protein
MAFGRRFVLTSWPGLSGHQKRHASMTDGRDKPGHDGTNEWRWMVIGSDRR